MKVKGLNRCGVRRSARGLHFLEKSQGLYQVNVVVDIKSL